MKTGKCPECEAEVEIKEDDKKGDTIECDECGAELELTAPDDDPVGLEVIEEEDFDDDEDDEF